MGLSLIVIVVVVTALAFDFTNGFHDTANAMATSIATGALQPKVAVLIAGVLNLVGAFLSVEVAKTISSGLVDEAKITPVVIFAGLVGAILWNLLTWLLGLPVEFLARPVRRPDRRDLVAAGVERRALRRRGDKVAAARRDLPARSPAWSRSIATYLAYRITARGERRHGQARLQGRPDRVGVDGRAGPRHQRRAEDDGRHHPDADHRRRARRRTPGRRSG